MKGKPHVYVQPPGISPMLIAVRRVKNPIQQNALVVDSGFETIRHISAA